MLNRSRLPLPLRAEDHEGLFRAAGLTDVELLGSRDYFAESSSAETRTVAAAFGARTVVMRAVKE